jgi:hypothetical protein
VATIANRSAFIVSVARHSALARTFAHDALADITAYVKELGEQGFKPSIKQIEDQMQVRIRRVGKLFATNEASH